MACHTAFEVDFYRQTAVVFSHSLDPKRTFIATRKEAATLIQQNIYWLKPTQA